MQLCFKARQLNTHLPKFYFRSKE